MWFLAYYFYYFKCFFGHFFLQCYTAMNKQLKEKNTLDRVTPKFRFNRRAINTHFNKELEKTVIDSSPLPLILIDIDHFKK
jgi:PleD family two-component response regulator